MYMDSVGTCMEGDYSLRLINNLQILFPNIPDD